MEPVSGNRDLWAMRDYYLVLNYMKMKSYKKKQTTKMHESHLLLVNSSGSQVLGFVIFRCQRTREGMEVGRQENSLDSLGQQQQPFLNFSIIWCQIFSSLLQVRWLSQSQLYNYGITFVSWLFQNSLTKPCEEGGIVYMWECKWFHHDLIILY